MDSAVKFLKQAVVGRDRHGRRLKQSLLENWAKEHWSQKFSYVPQIQLLTKEWFGFMMNLKVDAEWVRSRSWSMEGFPIILKKRDPLFDPCKGKIP